MDKVTNLRITDSELLPSPISLCEEISRTPLQKTVVRESRKQIHSIIKGEDKRLLAVVGPCSIHDLNSCREYAERFSELAKELGDRLMMVMRVYFEKPRTTVGWKGLIMDPQLNGSCDIPKGLRIARKFLGEVLDLGLPTATELLDPITHSISQTRFAGLRLVPEHLNRKHTVRWHPDYLCQLVLKMQLVEI